MNTEEIKTLFGNLSVEESMLANNYLATPLLQRVDMSKNTEFRKEVQETRNYFVSTTYMEGELVKCRAGFAEWVNLEKEFRTMTHQGVLYGLHSITEETLNGKTISVFLHLVYRKNEENALVIAMVYLKGRKLESGYRASMWTAKSQAAIAKREELARIIMLKKRENSDDINTDDTDQLVMPDVHEYKLLNAFYMISTFPSKDSICLHYF